MASPFSWPVLVPCALRAPAPVTLGVRPPSHAMPLSQFDFSLLRDHDFKEDSVREEIICPLLKHLGYSASPPHKIVRSRGLVHPFVQIGTRKSEIKIIPDYLMEIAGKVEWILDAKSPKENIHKGVNVEQAFSYAIHPDVRAFTYALCNGHHLVVFSVNRSHPILDIQLKDLSKHIEQVTQTLSPMAFIDPSRLKFRPDFGLYCHKIGIKGSVAQHFYDIGIPSITRVNDSLYSAFLNIQTCGEWFALSLDFDKPRFLELLSCIPAELALEIQTALTSQPYKIDLNERAPIVNVTARVSKQIHQNEKESYSPLRVDQFGVV